MPPTAGEQDPRRGADAGREAAARALRVVGTLPPMKAAAVLRFQSVGNIAVGCVPWGLPSDGRVLEGGFVVDVHEDDAAETIDRALDRAEGTQVVALVRDAQRRPWVLRGLDHIAARRPDVVVAEMGWPGTERLPGAASVVTHGASALNASALDDLLTRGVTT